MLHREGDKEGGGAQLLDYFSSLGWSFETKGEKREETITIRHCNEDSDLKFSPSSSRNGALSDELENLLCMGKSFAVLDMYLLSGIVDSYLLSTSSSPSKTHYREVIDLGILRAYEKKEVGWAAAEMKQNFKLALQSKKGLQAEKYMRDLLILSQVLVNDKHWLLAAIRIPSKFWGKRKKASLCRNDINNDAEAKDSNIKKKSFPTSNIYSTDNTRNSDDDDDDEEEEDGHLIELFCVNSTNEARVRSLSDLQQQYETKRILPAMRQACQETILLLQYDDVVGEEGAAVAAAEREGEIGEKKKKKKEKKKGNEYGISTAEENVASTAACNYSSQRPSSFFFGYAQGLQYGNMGCGFSCALNKARLLQGNFVNRRIRSTDRKTKKVVLFTYCSHLVNSMNIRQKVRKEFQLDGEIITFEEEEFDKSRSIDRSIRTSKGEETALRVSLYHALKQRRKIAAELKIVTKRRLCKFNDVNT